MKIEKKFFGDSPLYSDSFKRYRNVEKLIEENFPRKLTVDLWLSQYRHLVHHFDAFSLRLGLQPHIHTCISQRLQRDNLENTHVYEVAMPTNSRVLRLALLCAFIKPILLLKFNLFETKWENTAWVFICSTLLLKIRENEICVCNLEQVWNFNPKSRRLIWKLNARNYKDAVANIIIVKIYII